MVAILKGFRDFLLKGDLITTAVGLAMGLVTVALTESLVENLITPIVAAILGQPDFADLHFTINGSVFKYGAFINSLVVFIREATRPMTSIHRNVHASRGTSSTMKNGRDRSGTQRSKFTAASVPPNPGGTTPTIETG